MLSLGKMSAVTEIESAIENLDNSDLREFSAWWSDFIDSKTPSSESAREQAIKGTSGILTGKSGEEFAELVAVAGCDSKDTHEW